MIPDCGKTACPILLPDGSLCAFHNAIIDNSQDVVFKDEYGNSKYTLSFGEEDEDKGYRALVYKRYMPSSTLDNSKTFVIYLPDDASGGTEGQPIYDCIAPQVAQMNGTNGMTLIYWANLIKGKSMSSNYSSDAIYKIEDTNIEYEDFQNVEYKVLLAACIRFEMLSVNGSTPMLTPICYKINVLGTYDYAVSDYAGNGGGGYEGMFKIEVQTHYGSDGEKTFTVHVYDAFEGEGGGIARINQYQFNMGSYSFSPSGEYEYIMLHSQVQGDGTGAKPTQPEYVVEDSFPDDSQILEDECYILLGRIYYDEDEQRVYVSQESYGIPQGFIFAKCEDEEGAFDPDDKE